MVEGARLESVCAGNRTEGSNPFLSAKVEYQYYLFRVLLSALMAGYQVRFGYIYLILSGDLTLPRC